MENLKIGPLEELAELTGVMYLSDLQKISYDLVRRQIRNIEPDKYSLFQWQDTAKYLTGNDVDMETITNLTQRNERNGLVEVTIEAYNQDGVLVLKDVTEAVVKCRGEG